MQRLRRFAAFLASLAMLQLVVLGGTGACIMPSATPGAVMSGMEGMGGMARQAAGSVTHPAPTNAGRPCGTSSAPATDCQAMGACALAVLPIATSLPVRSSLLPSGVIAFAGCAPLSRTTAPELPPPRA